MSWILDTVAYHILIHGYTEAREPEQVPEKSWVLPLKHIQIQSIGWL